MAQAVFNDKVYTSYFREVVKHVLPKRRVSISKTSPHTFNGVYYRKLNPPWELVELYKTGKIDVAEYEEIYNDKILSNLDPYKVYNDLKGKVMCCWEGKNEFCHRHLVMQWLANEIGDEYIGGEL